MILSGNLRTLPKLIADLPSGGSVGAAAVTVDTYTELRIAQTTVGQALTLPSPTASADGYQLTVINTGTASFTLNGVTVNPATSITFHWGNGVWTPPAGNAGVTVATSSFNALTYGADQTGVADSWAGIQKAIDKTTEVKRGFGGSASASSTVLTIDSVAGGSWYGFEASDVDRYICIEANLGLIAGDYPLKIASVISPTQCTIKKAGGATVTFSTAFSGLQVVWLPPLGSIPIYGGEAFVPTGKYAITKTLEMVTSAQQLRGGGAGTSPSPEGTLLNFLYPSPGIVQRDILSAAKKWALRGPALVTGATSSYVLAIGDPTFFWDYNESRDVWRTLPGATAFTVECFLRPTAIATDYQEVIWASYGQLVDAAAHSAFKLFTNISGNLVFTVDINGTTQTITGTTVLSAAGTVYHVAVQFDGAALRLFLNGVVEGTPVTGLTGGLVMKGFEVFSLGGLRAPWAGLNVQVSALRCYVSSFRVSSTARYAAGGFTAPTTALTADATTLLLDRGEISDEKFFIVNVTGLSAGYGMTTYGLIKHGGDPTFIDYQSVSDLSMVAYGPGLHAVRLVKSRWERITILGQTVGIMFDQDTFLDYFDKINLGGNGAARGGLIMVGPAGVNEYRNINITAFSYCALLTDGSGVIQNWFIHGASRIQVVLENWKGQVSALNCSNEDVFDSKFECNVYVGGNRSDVTFIESNWETYSFPRPSIIVGSPLAITLISPSMEPNLSAIEMIQIDGVPQTKVLIFNGNRGRLTFGHTADGIPWSTASSTKWTTLP